MIDLFESRLPDKKLHASFRMIRDNPAYAEVLPIIQGWGAGLTDRKGEQDKFIKEFQSTFNSSMWELYLNKALIDLGYDIDYSKSSPDFCVTTPKGYKFNIEAVVSDVSPGDLVRRTPGEQEFKNRGALKLAGKLKDKIDIFRGTGAKKHPYALMDHVKDLPFVVAIAPFDNEFSLTQNNELINLVLFGLGAPDLKELRQQVTVQSIFKPSGAKVDVGIFTNDSFKEISAVIFSTVGTFGKAVFESKLDRLVRATHYRVNNKEFIRAEEENWLPGTRWYTNNNLTFLIESRQDFGECIAGSDVHIYHSKFHRESHFDGLHVYYNPYAENALDPEVIWPAEITHNFYDTTNNCSIQNHPDGALVSRQFFSPTLPTLVHLLKHYRFF